MRRLIEKLFANWRKEPTVPARFERDDRFVKRTVPLPRFKTELELKTFLANNLDYLEPGLRLFKNGSWCGIEVPCTFSEWSRPGLIDILAEDRYGDLVVIELKPDGKAGAFGQLLCYLAWMKQWASSNDPRGRTRAARNVRGIIVAKKATPMLLFLVRAYPMHPVTVYESEPVLKVTLRFQREA